jgi:hypothetical protein
VTQQPARPTIQAGHAVGLAVYVATAALLAAILVSLIVKWPTSLQEISVVFAAACALVAAVGMLIDAVDLWIRGRRMAPQAVTMVRAMVFVAVIGALATAMLGKSTAVVIYLMPAMLIYLLISRRRPAAAAARASRRGSAGARSGGTSSVATKSRQRKGGKKHR